MNRESLSQYLESRPEIEWKREGNDILLRHTQYDKETEGIRLDLDKLEKITPEVLDKALVNGRNIDQYTRITGYFGKISNFNKGKLGELHDRQRVVIN